MCRVQNIDARAKILGKHPPVIFTNEPLALMQCTTVLLLEVLRNFVEYSISNLDCSSRVTFRKFF